MAKRIPFSLTDLEHPHGKLSGEIVIENAQLFISLKGHGNQSEVGGPIMGLQYDRGIGRLIVFRDINSEEPTEALDLDGALETRRDGGATMGIAAAKVGHWIKADGTSEQVMPEKGKKFSLQELQKMVGGYVERLKLPSRMVMILNEEGFPKGLPDNPRASEIAGRPIVGDVVVLPSGMGW